VHGQLGFGASSPKRLSLAVIGCHRPTRRMSADKCELVRTLEFDRPARTIHVHPPSSAVVRQGSERSKQGWSRRAQLDGSSTTRW